MNFIKQRGYASGVIALVFLCLGVMSGCDETYRATGGGVIPKKYSCKSVLMTAAELKDAYGNANFLKLSFKLVYNTATNEVYPQFYAIATDNTATAFRYVTVLDESQNIWLKPVIESKYDIVKTGTDQIQKLLSIPKVDHFILQPWSFDDPNYPSDANLLEYLITPYDAYGNELDLTPEGLGVSDNQLQRLIRIDPIPPGGRY